MIMLDTSFVVAYFNTNDQNHKEAVNTSKTLVQLNSELCITDYIFGEIATVSLLKLKDVKKAAQIGNLVLESCNVIPVKKDAFDDAWKIFSGQRLRLSFTDCTTIATMHSQGMQEIATFDKDFARVEGITVLR